MRRLYVVIIGLMATLYAGAALAEDASEPAGYREIIEQALSEYGHKNYEEASTLFGQAHQLYPNARTLRGLGMAAFELRRYDESADNLEAALASKARPLDGELRTETEGLLARARGFLAVVELRVSPGEARVLLDGQAVEPGKVNLRLGEHTFEARAESYRPERQTVRVHGGESMQVAFSLERDKVASAPVEERNNKRPLYKNPWLWTSVAVVVVGGAVAGALLATRDKGTETVPAPTQNGVGVWLSARSFGGP